MEIQSKSNRTRRGTAVCIAILLALFVLLCIRAPYGFDWTDEPYYSVLPYRLSLGDRPFVDTWEVHQLSGILALPFLRLFQLFSGGSTDGIMLYFRYVLLVVQLLCALYAFAVLRRRGGNAPALLFAGLTMMHAHFGINGFSYNTMAPLLVVLSALCCFDALDGRHFPLKMLLSGMFYALSVQVYPYFVISLPVWIVACLLWRKSAPGAKAVCRRAALYWLAGLAGTAILFLLYVFTKASPAELLSNISGLLGDPDHTSANLLWVLANYCNATRVLFGPVFIGAVLLFAVGLTAWLWKDPLRQQQLRRWGLLFALLLAALSVVWIIAYDYPNEHKINLAAMSLALLLPGLFCLSGGKPDRSLLLFFLGLALSLAVQVGSNTRIRAASGALLPASLGTLLYLFDVSLRQWNSDRPNRGILFAAATLVCAAQLALTTGLRLITVYRDEPLPSLGTILSDGPAQGIVTTGSNAAAYTALLSDLTENAPESGSILITNLMPVGYLMTTLRPAAPSTFNMTMDAPWLIRYYELHPQRRPDYIFAVTSAIGSGNELSLQGVNLLSSDYQRVETLSGTCFIRGGN